MLLQLADFGLSRVMETNATHISTNTIGTIAYQPEEVKPSFRLFSETAWPCHGQAAPMEYCFLFSQAVRTVWQHPMSVHEAGCWRRSSRKGR